MPESEPAERDNKAAWIKAGAAVVAALIGLVGTWLLISNDGDDDIEITAPVDDGDTGAPDGDGGDDNEVCVSSAEGDLIDDPDWSPDKAKSGNNEGWRGGDPVGGVGEPQYYGGAKYAFASGVGGWDQSNSEATWYLGPRAGMNEIEAHVPPNHATATVTYHIYRDRVLLQSTIVNQAIEKGWVTLASNIDLGDEPGEVTVTVYYRDSLPAGNIPEPEGRSIAIDAIRITCR